MRRHASIFSLTALGLALTAATAAGQGPGQGPPTSVPGQTPGGAARVSLPAAALRRFDDALPALAARAHVALVCEGQPLHSELAQDPSDHLALHLRSPGLPADQAVAEVAAAYDYDARRLGPTLFVLTKRYTDPADLPDVPFDEALTSLQNIQTATQDFAPALGPDQALLQMLRAATLEQRARLAEGISVSDLPADWQRETWQLACSLNFRPLRDLATVTRRLQACRRRSTVFLYRQYLNLTVPAYQGPFAAGGATDFFALSAWVDTTPGGGTTIDEVAGVHIVPGPAVSVEPGVTDPTTPRPAGRIPPPFVSTLRLSLAAAVQHLSERLAAGGDASGLRTVHVAPTLASKAVCLAGEGNAPPGALLGALAAAYGLEVTREQNAATLGQPHPRILNDPGTIVAEVRRLLPAPYVRALTAPTPLIPANGETAGGQGPGGGAADPMGGYSSERAEALFVASVRRLREIVEPVLKRRPERRLPVPDAGAEALALVALSSLTKCVPELPALAAPANSYLSHFGQATLTLSAGGGRPGAPPPRTPNPNAFNFKIQYQGSDGKGSGVAGNVTFPPGTFG